MLAILALLFVASRGIAHLATERLWYREMGQERVFWTLLAGPWLAGCVVGLATTALLLVNAHFAERMAPSEARALLAGWPRRALQATLVAVALTAGLVAGRAVLDGHWQQLVLWAHRRPFGATDPLFGKDVGFFVFSLPLLRAIAGWLLLIAALALAGAVATHLATGAIRVRPAPVSVAPAARRHVLMLIALVLALLAWQHHLARFALALPHSTDDIPGAGYTAVHVELPWLRALVVIDLAAAVAMAIAAWTRSWVLPAITVALVALMEVFSPTFVPGLVQRFVVEPQTLSRERPYLADAIASTRRAYGLDRVASRSIPANATISPQDLAANADVLRNIQLWDQDVLRPEINHQQETGSYYHFSTITVDRYPRNGQPRAMMVAEREVDLRRLDPSGRTWANDHLAYTHGYGLIAVPGGDAGVDDQGKPRVVTATRLRQPRIYVGVQPEGAMPWVVAATHRPEVEKPATGDASPATYHYAGDGGIPMAGIAPRAILALGLGDVNLLLSHTLGARPRLLLHRSVEDRLRTLAPFLQWDRDLQAAVVDGRVVFLAHGYTTTDAYPYSTQVRVGGRRLNYLRASVVATVDAFTGRTTLYVTDRDDPLIAAWQGVLPTLLRPASAMPAGVRAHLRYPGRLFAVQARVWGAYHLDDVDAFYTRADAWKRPADVSGPIQEVGRLDDDDAPRLAPQYVLARLPGQADEQFLLTTPFTPYGKENLTGYLAGAVDARGGTHLMQLTVPRAQRVLGPAQVARQILASPVVSDRLRLLNIETTDLGKQSVNIAEIGRPRVIPLGDAFLSVQAIYVTNRASGVTRLRLVTVFVNGRIGYGDTLMEAIQNALGAAPVTDVETDAG